MRIEPPLPRLRIPQPKGTCGLCCTMADKTLNTLRPWFCTAENSNRAPIAKKSCNLERSHKPAKGINAHTLTSFFTKFLILFIHNINLACLKPSTQFCPHSELHEVGVYQKEGCSTSSGIQDACEGAFVSHLKQKGWASTKPHVWRLLKKCSPVATSKAPQSGARTRESTSTWSSLPLMSSPSTQ